jgi:hypothetical protein
MNQAPARTCGLAPREETTQLPRHTIQKLSTQLPDNMPASVSWTACFDALHGASNSNSNTCPNCTGVAYHALPQLALYSPLY